ncbi:hypothetical protein FBEOM_13952 [Fusarium beomiforme]|uniref:Uncharacterized protein n=1 Tax=Fusarium beomiforme TaxID=44412 RepID=A0A9P5A4V0_9HYPO|nr:hypothetical protein FBEOM_13952 [Fusarium beomiforme]
MPQANVSWKGASFVKSLEAIPSSYDRYSDDSKILLVFLSFLSISDKIPPELFFRGAVPCKRWSAEGNIEDVDATHSDLSQELSSFLSDESRLHNSLDELRSSSAILDDSEGSYTLNEAMSGISKKLTAEDLSFWRCQVLVAVYRAIPWKYIEYATIGTKLLLPHLKHILQSFQSYSDRLSLNTRADLVLTLIEASRFPDMAWKKFAVGQAKVTSRALEDRYTEVCIAQAQSLVHRIAGDVDRAVNSINLVQVRTSMDRRIHSAIGFLAVQSSLNCIQVEDLSTAEELLKDWKFLDEHPSLLERVVMFRKHAILGRILRFKGAFQESLEHLQKAQQIAAAHQQLIFDEDLCDLACDHADTLRELDEPVSAEQRLRVETTRQRKNQIFNKSRLELALAEALFGQGRFKEAEELCLAVQSRKGLLRFEKLRLQITMAKILHSKSDKERAFSYWSNAMEEIAKFRLTNGHTTRIIILSIRDTLSDVGQKRLREASLEQDLVLYATAKPGGTKYWIGGLGHWARLKGFSEIALLED